MEWVDLWVSIKMKWMEVTNLKLAKDESLFDKAW